MVPGGGNTSGSSAAQGAVNSTDRSAKAEARKVASEVFGSESVEDKAKMLYVNIVRAAMGGENLARDKVSREQSVGCCCCCCCCSGTAFGRAAFNFPLLLCLIKIIFLPSSLSN